MRCRVGVTSSVNIGSAELGALLCLAIPPLDMAKPIVVELTAKKYKKWMLVGMLLFIVGVVGGFIAVVTRHPEIAFLVMPAVALGLAIYMIAKFLAWWNNG